MAEVDKDISERWAAVAVTPRYNIWDVFLPPIWDYDQGLRCREHLVGLMSNGERWLLRAHCREVKNYSVKLGPMWVKTFANNRDSISEILVVDPTPVLSFVIGSSRLALRQVPMRTVSSTELDDIPPRGLRRFPA